MLQEKNNGRYVFLWGAELFGGKLAEGAGEGIAGGAVEGSLRGLALFYEPGVDEDFRVMAEEGEADGEFGGEVAAGAFLTGGELVEEADAEGV